LAPPVCGAAGAEAGRVGLYFADAGLCGGCRGGCRCATCLAGKVLFDTGLAGWSGRGLWGNRRSSGSNRRTLFAGQEEGSRSGTNTSQEVDQVG